MSDFLHRLLQAHPQEVNVLSFLGNVAVTYLVGTSTFGSLGRRLGLDDNKTVSEAYPVLVTPSGYAFSIWGLIFGLETGFTVWQLQHEKDVVLKAYLAQVTPSWCLTCWLQAVWGIAFGSRSIGLSSLLLTAVPYSLNKLHWNLTNSGAIPGPHFLTKLPFSLHLGWTLAAGLINWNIFLKYLGVSSAVQRKVAWVSVGLSVLASCYLGASRDDPVIPLVNAWALFAVSVKEKDPNQLQLSPSQLETFSTMSKVSSLMSMTVAAALVVHGSVM